MGTSVKKSGESSSSVTESSTESRSSSSGGGSSKSYSGVSSNEGSSSPVPLGWPIRKAEVSKLCVLDLDDDQKTRSGSADSNSKKAGPTFSEIDMMRERFSKLLLGEDMSGSGKGVCTALAISNAITNLCGSVFGQLWRLEPLSAEKKAMWRREMELLLCVTDHIVEFMPSWQTYPDGSKVEIMSCRPRLDIFINLPALRKLDNLLLEILDSFVDTEFWYVDQGILAPETDGSASFRKAIQRQEEKWWLPVPRVPLGGLLKDSRKQLHQKRECANQILKAAMAINSIVLADMEVPDSFLETLPKNGRASLGDVIYRYITSHQFSSECLLDCLDLSSEHVALELANRVEAAIYVWRRRNHLKPVTSANRSTAKSSWEMVKDFMVDGDKRELLAERAEGLLLSLKQRFPCLAQTTLDASKIQNNKDVGRSILESYSRVLESLAYNVVARIDDLLYVDDLTRHSDKFPSVSTVSVTSHKRVSIPYGPVPFSGTPYRSASGTPTLSPAPLASPARGERTPLIHNLNCKPHRRGLGVKKVLSNYLNGETRGKNTSALVEALTAARTSSEGLERPKESSVRAITTRSRQNDQRDYDV